MSRSPLDGSALREWRERHGLTVDELAAELDVPSAMLERWEESKATIPRRRVTEIATILARLERHLLRTRSRRLPRLQKPRSSPFVLLVPLLLLVASFIGYLPASDAWPLALVPLGLAASGILLVDVHRSLPWLRGAGALGRWLAHCVAGTAAMVAFAGTFVVSGYTGFLTSAEPLPLAGALVLAVVMGVLYATGMSLHDEPRRRRR